MSRTWFGLPGPAPGLLRTYDVRAARLSRPVPWRPVRSASISMRSPGLVATHTRTFLFADIEGSAAMGRRLSDTYEGVLADHHRLVRTVLAVHGGEEAGTRGDELSAVFASPRDCAVAAIQAQRTL